MARTATGGPGGRYGSDISLGNGGTANPLEVLRAEGRRQHERREGPPGRGPAGGPTGGGRRGRRDRPRRRDRRADLYQPGGRAGQLRTLTRGQLSVTERQFPRPGP